MNHLRMALFTRAIGKNHCYGAPFMQKITTYLKGQTRSYCSAERIIKRSKPLLSPPEYDWLLLCNPAFTKILEKNIADRKGVGDIHKVIELYKQLEDATNSSSIDEIKEQLLEASSELPNISHPNSPIGDESCAERVEVYGQKRDFAFKPKSVVELGSNLSILRTKDTALTTGQRTYYFTGALVKLEQALIKYTLDKLLDSGFTLVSVPDLIPAAIIEACGFKTFGERNQVYKLDSDEGDMCLAGTAEMSLGGLFMNEVLQDSELPKKVAAVSRCFRAETSNVEEESGIYRVHQFTKVEMFGLTANDSGEESENLFQEFINIQRELFSGLGLHFQILNMPTHELGAPAYKKYDIESWMPNKKFYGEISSTSNCTDFQSRRLHIKYVNDRYAVQHVHTVNGTACAVPRMIMAILENYQNSDGSVDIPDKLVKYIGMERIEKKKEPTVMRWMKFKKT